MAMVDHVSDTTDDADYEAHVTDYRRFVRLLWMNVAAIAVILVLLAAWAG